MSIDFNDLPWHDANLQSIYMDRRNPGEQDCVKLLIDWPNDTSSTIEFHDCYAFTANMNFGIVAPESILTAECVIDSKELILIREEWLKVGINLEKLKDFNLLTNSTNSIIRIFALGFRIIND